MPTNNNTKENVTTGKPKTAGAIYRAPAGTSVPTDATTALDAAFKAMGFISEDGVTNSSSFDTEVIREWGGDAVYEAESNREDTFRFKMIEALNPEVLKAVHNASNVTGAIATGLTVKVNSDEHENAAWVIDMIMRNGTLKRICIPDAKITEIAEVVYRRNEAVGYDVTLKAFADSSGQYHYEYLKTPSSSGTGGTA